MLRFRKNVRKEFDRLVEAKDSANVWARSVEQDLTGAAKVVKNDANERNARATGALLNFPRPFLFRTWPARAWSSQTA